jgi:hypothetical protein
MPLKKNALPQRIARPAAFTSSTQSRRQPAICRSAFYRSCSEVLADYGG